jgi:hypothetical protein
MDQIIDTMKKANDIVQRYPEAHSLNDVIVALGSELADTQAKLEAAEREFASYRHGVSSAILDEIKEWTGDFRKPVTVAMQGLNDRLKALTQEDNEHEG